MSERPPRITRFGAGALTELADVLAEVRIARALLVATRRGAKAAGSLPVVGVYDGVGPHVPVAHRLRYPVVVHASLYLSLAVRETRDL